jgi:putative DNA primase/helicase
MSDAPTITADEIFTRASAPMAAAVRAARQVIAGEAPDDELRDTDTALAACFALDHYERLQFDHRRRAWMVCDRDSSVWRPEQSGEASRMLQNWSEQRAFDRVAEATNRHDLMAVRAAVRRTLSARGVRDCLGLATFQEALACAGTEWDSDPHILGTVGGQRIDLRTGAIRPLRPGDRITRAAAVALDASAPCERFERFMREIMSDDADLVALLRAALGYSITGDISEQVFFVAIGSGANGKSTLLELLAFVLGDLSGVLPFGTLTRDRDSRAVQAEIADLPGTRFVRASEVREGVHLDEGRLKSLTGGDPISAARKFGHPFVFRPEFKLWLGVNHRPRVTDRSHGFWRRAVPIPFGRTFGVDKRLEPQLRDEAPAILAWLVSAAAEWYRTGLPRTDAAEAARSEWRDTEDVIGQWAASALAPAPGERLKTSRAFEAFTAWATSEGLTDRERPGRRAFGEWMAAQYPAGRSAKERYYEARLVTHDVCDTPSGEVSLSRTRGELLQQGRHPVSSVTPDAEGFARVRP